MEQTDLWSQDEDEDHVAQDPEVGRINELNKQNRNLRLLSPIYRIEQYKSKVGGKADMSIAMDSIDTVYLSILVLEYYAAYALSRESLPVNEVIHYLQVKIEKMCPQLSSEDGYRISAWVHDSLCNQLENYKAFRFSCFNPVKQVMNYVEFWLIKIEKVQNGNECKITEEGVTALLTYINANPKLQDEVTTLLTQRLIKTGRYEDALQMAERSRKTVIQYQERISTASDKVRREAKAGKLSEVVLPLIRESSEHVMERLKEEDETLRNLSQIAMSQLDNKTTKLVNKLKVTINNNLIAYRKLYDHIGRVQQGFEQTIRCFLRPSRGVIPNMVNNLLQPMCQWQVEILSNHADDVVDLIMPPKLPAIFDVITLLDSLNITGEQERNKVIEVPGAKMKTITRIKPLFPEDMIEKCKFYYQKKLAEKKQISLQQLLLDAEQELLSSEFQHCLAYIVIMSFSDDQSVQYTKLGLQFSKQKRFQHHFMMGDDLLIQVKGHQDKT